MAEQGLSLEREAALIERAQRGDGDAFGEIYDAYKRTLHAAIIYPRLRNAQAAEDVLQETFCLAMEKLHTFRFEGKSILLWLKMIAINKTREYLAKNRRVFYTEDDSLMDALADASGPTPEGFLLAKEKKKELLDRIGECLEDINDRYREALRLRLIEKKSRAKCAEILDVTIENFDIIFFRASRAFRKAYTSRYGTITEGSGVE